MSHTLGRTHRVHLVGIGGAGMSAIAEVLLNQNFMVSGSDQAQSEVTDRLAKLGATVFIGHRRDHISISEKPDVVVHSSAVNPAENLETLEAAERKIPVVKRDEMLGELMRKKSGICIAGTHGKTTTTTMTGVVLNECGIKPTVLIGGVSDYFKSPALGASLTSKDTSLTSKDTSLTSKDTGGSAIVGDGEYFVIEADEYDRTFLKLTPTIAVITTLEAEHLDIYKDLDDIKAAFIEFANKVPFYGAVICCLDEPNIQDVIASFKRRVISYGVNPQADLQATDIDLSGGASFTVKRLGKALGRIALAVPGLHNIKNALAAVAVGLEVGLEFGEIQSALEKFVAVRRRFQVKRAAEESVMVVDDYAHHPTEVRATLEAAKAGWSKRRVVAVFQPHLYSRTKEFAEDFAKAFLLADVLVVTNVYGSRENPALYEGVTGELVTEAAKRIGHKEVHYIADKKELAKFLVRLSKPDDLIITLGAGDITQACDELVRLLDAKEVSTVK